MKVGTIVTFTADQLGTMRTPTSSRFEELTVMRGDVGVYNGPHPNAELAEKDWHLIVVEATEQDEDGRLARLKLFCPVHSSQFTDWEPGVQRKAKTVRVKGPSTKGLSSLLP